MDKLDINTEVQKSLTDMMAVALQFNASVIEYASMVIAAGPVKDEQQYKRHVNEFSRIHDDANAKHIKIIEELEKRLGDDRS